MTPEDSDLLAEVSRELAILPGHWEWNCPTAEFAVDINRVEPPTRSPGTVGFDRTRLTSLMRQLRSAGEIPPVGLRRLGGRPYEYAVYDGYHRFWISLALGVRALPALLVEPIELR
ncbi:ParB/RepB/Spo0J family partition protein [Phenylobacterium sp.]|uniref:ParB/RepB/Spo0J family partition protein n=1 Tax=Phenylobacterium sp. TaxID=1871053 RepID=UPI00272F19BB|nr:ParB/RepB/Spo0J family partition protein [Phenylobacterium sp.]MDP1872547.1 ParB/RepB/Spo0J family partition protein [Phenylobacterium sp.]